MGTRTGPRAPWSASDRGSATVWTVGALAVLCVVFGAVLAMGQAVVVRHRAGGAADLAALAAADHWTDGGTRACGLADRVARAQGTRIVRCAVRGDISDVTVAAGRGPLTAEVRSRAGPAGPLTPGGPPGLVTPGGPGAPDSPDSPDSSVGPGGPVGSMTAPGAVGRVPQVALGGPASAGDPG
ncbi:Rv3654c family TadE-like protein [Streptomyces sp. BV286]|uniref:Rv3654c family TadE-like protein n=1 Tax=Streptomyces sp. BV286 TaxID=2849672 RepID=UPI0027E593AF|nr:Rv3654c family TadE-like protein [Streptomyces sp. BV286]